MCCTRVLNLNAYFCDDSEEVRAAVKMMCEREFIQEAAGGDMTWEDALPAAKKVRLQAYRELAAGQASRIAQTGGAVSTEDVEEISSDSEAETMSLQTSPEKSSMGACGSHSTTDTGSASCASSSTSTARVVAPYIFDLEQTAGERPRMSNDVFPCLTRKIDYFSDASNRGLTSRELFSVVGVPLLPQHHVSWKCNWMELLDPTHADCLSQTSVSSLAGNAMHLNAIGTLMMWLLANYVRKPIADPLADLPLMSAVDPGFFQFDGAVTLGESESVTVVLTDDEAEL
jgi:hypothetical protein